MASNATTSDTQADPDNTGGGRPPKRVLVALDGSPRAEAALYPAAEIAKRSSSALHLAAIISPATVRPPSSTDGVVQLAPTDVDDAGMASYLGMLADRLRLEWDCPVASRILVHAPAARGLAEISDHLDADLVVTALDNTARAGGVDLVSRLSRRVLLVPSVPAGATPNGADGRGGRDVVAKRSIGSAVDGPRGVVAAIDPVGDPSQVVLHAGRDLASLWGAALHVVQVVVQVPFTATGTNGTAPLFGVARPRLTSTSRGARAATGRSHEAMELAGVRLGQLETSLRRVGVDARTRVLTGTDGVTPIAEFVDATEGADLLVVGRRPPLSMGAGRIAEGSDAEALGRTVRSAGVMMCPLD